MATDRELIDRLGALEAGATEGPWAWEAVGEKSNDAVLGVVWSERLGGPVSGRADFNEYDEKNNEYTHDQQMVDEIAERINDANYADFDFIAELRNAAPRLIALAEKGMEAETHLDLLRREVRAWRSAMDNGVLELASGEYNSPPTRETREEFDMVRQANDAVDAAGALGGGA
jgi:hypothetical protein